MRSLWADIEALDNAVPRQRAVRHVLSAPADCCVTPATGCCANVATNLHIDKAVRELRAGVGQLTDGIGPRRSAARPACNHEATMAELTGGGVPEKLARRVARLALLEPALDIVALARSERVAGCRRGACVLRTRRGAGPRLAARRDRSARRSMAPGRRRARTGLRDAAMRAHRELTQQVLRHAWCDANQRARGALERAASRCARRMEAHAHRNAGDWCCGLRHAHRGRRRGPQPCECLDRKGAPRAGDHHVRAPRCTGRRARQRRAPDAWRPTEITDRRRRLGLLDTRGHRHIHRALARCPCGSCRSHTLAFASAACAISPSPRRDMDYLVFIDGDMLLHPDFIADHARLCAPWLLHPGRACACRRTADRTADRRSGAATRILVAGIRRSAPRLSTALAAAGLVDAHDSRTRSSPSRRATRASGATTWSASTASTKRSRAGAPEDKELVRATREFRRAPADAACSAASPATCTTRRHRATALPRNLALLEAARRERRVRCERGLDAHFRSRAQRAQIE